MKGVKNAIDMWNHMARQVRRVAKDALERSIRTDNKIKKVGIG